MRSDFFEKALHGLLEVISQGRGGVRHCDVSDIASASGDRRPPLVLPEAHEHWELVVCAGGSLRIVGWATSFLLRPGDAVLVEPRAWHYETWNRRADSYQALWIAGSPGVIRLISSSYKRGHFQIDATRSMPPLGDVFILHSLRQELRSGKSHAQLKAWLLLAGFLVDLLRGLEGEGATGSTPRDEPLRRLAHVIKTRFREPLQLRDLAREIGVSQDYLGRRFRDYCGMTFRDRLNATRVHHAHSLLQLGHSIKEAADASGFEDVYYFTKVFKKYFHVTPGKAQREMRVAAPIHPEQKMVSRIAFQRGRVMRG